MLLSLEQGQRAFLPTIGLKHLDENLNVIVLEKGSEVGAHILSRQS